MIEAHDVEAIAAADVRSSDDAKVGSVGHVFLDAETGRPEWAAVRTGFFGTKEAFVPLRNADWDGRVVRVAYDKDRVRNAPHVDPDSRGLDPSQQAELYTYYGFTDNERQHLPSAEPTGLPAHDAGAEQVASESESEWPQVAEPRPVATAPTPDSATATATDTDDDTDDDDDGVLTLREERLKVDVAPQATERIRLRKRVVTEEETVTITIRREELTIDREPISREDAESMGAGDGIGDRVTEIVLYEERPVVTTVRRAVERIRLTTEAVEVEQTVTSDVRKERVAMDSTDLD